MSAMSRRLFIGRSAAAAAAVGLTAVANDAGARDPTVAVGDGAVMLFVRDAGAGEVVFLGDGTEAVVTDTQLAASLIRARRTAGV